MRGFTLIEFLIVCSIIGLLIAILVPAYTAAKKEPSHQLVTPQQAERAPLPPAMNIFSSRELKVIRVCDSGLGVWLYLAERVGGGIAMEVTDKPCP